MPNWFQSVFSAAIITEELAFDYHPEASVSTAAAAPAAAVAAGYFSAAAAAGTAERATESVHDDTVAATASIDFCSGCQYRVRSHSASTDNSRRWRHPEES